MYQSLIVIDEFLDNAREIREAALRLDYPDASEPTPYPGRNSTRRVNISGFDATVSRIVSERLEPLPNSLHGTFRACTAGETGSWDVHVDNCHWSGVYFLSDPRDCSGGTDFFRHRATNSDHAPYSEDHLRAWGYASYKEFVDKVSRPDSTDPSKWERVMRVPMKFNRLILFRPWLWHTSGPGFGDRLSNARLVYLLFYNSLGPLHQPR